MIALVDCNNFYASVERLFDPRLRGRPVVVLSNNDGCAIARSEEAKAMGIEMGTPAFKIRELPGHEKVVLFSSNYTLYGSMSDRVLKLLRSFVPRVEAYSIDEAFLDLSGFAIGELPGLANQIRDTLMAHTGLPVSVGIAPTKTLAKIANRHAKKFLVNQGFHVAALSEGITEMLQSTDVGDIWGIGPQHRKILIENKICTAADLLKAPDDWIQKQMSVVGRRLVFELKGINAVEWEEAPPSKKNICTARSFGKLLTSLKEISQAIASHAASCARKLRMENSHAKKVQVFLQTNPYRSDDKQYLAEITLQLPIATNSTNEIIKNAIRALNLIFRPGFSYLKAGVVMLEIVPDNQVQLNLFDNRNHTNDKKLMKALDVSNNQFGKEMIRYGVQGYDKDWKLRSNRLSRKYTTRIDEVMIVRS